MLQRMFKVGATMTPPAPYQQRAWAIKSPNGKFVRINLNRKPALYNHDKGLGFKCVEVIIEQLHGKEIRSYFIPASEQSK